MIFNWFDRSGSLKPSTDDYIPFPLIIDPYEQINYEENANPKAKIGFVLFYPFQYYVQKDVYKHLKNNAEFIIDLGVFYPVKQPRELIESIISLLKKEGVFFRILYHDDYKHARYLERFFSKYGALVSQWKRGCMKLDCIRDIKKIHLPYGAGKDITTFGFWKSCFDLILAYGKRDHAVYSLYTKSKIVGNPKFDDWFSDRKKINKLANLNIDGRKKTVLYLPTHSDLCSIEYIAEELGQISQKYNVIAKLHYYTSHEEPERIELLEKGGITILKDDCDLLDLLSIADAVLSDNSSAIFDAILADKPVIATDFWSDEFIDLEHSRFKTYRRGISKSLTYSESIEQQLKKTGSIHTVKEPADLAQVVELALKDGEKFKKRRAKIRQELFSFNDGKCGQRAAKEINKFLCSSEFPKRPLVYHLIQDFARSEKEKAAMKKAAKAKKKATINETAVYEIRRNMPNVAWQKTLSVRLPYGCRVLATLNETHGGTKNMFIEVFNIFDELKTKEVCCHIFDALAKEGVSCGAECITLYIMHSQTLEACAELFGAHNLRFAKEVGGEYLDVAYEDLANKKKVGYVTTAYLKDYGVKEQK